MRRNFLEGKKTSIMEQVIELFLLRELEINNLLRIQQIGLNADRTD